MIAQRLHSFWMHSKNQCTLKNSEEDKEFDQATHLRKPLLQSRDGKCFEARNYERVLWQGLRATSHYGRRLRGHGFLPRLQETKSSASQPFTLEAKIHRPWLSKVPTWQQF